MMDNNRIDVMADQKNEDNTLNGTIASLKEKLKTARNSNNTSRDKKPYYKLIETIIERTEKIQESRSITWSDTLQKATIKRDKESRFGVKSSFSISDALTNVSDDDLAKGLKAIEATLNDNGINNANLKALKEFSDKLPSDEYKASIDTIYRAGLFCALAAATIMFPPLLPFTCPALTVTALLAGSAIMGLSAHISFRAFMNHAAAEVYEQERLKLLSNDKLVNQILENKGNKQESMLYTAVIAAMNKTEDNSAKTLLDKGKALKIVNKALRGDKKVNAQLADLSEGTDNIKFSLSEDTMSFLKDAIKIAWSKYRTFTVFMAASVVLQGALAAVSPAFALQTATSMVVGLGTVLSYEVMGAVVSKVSKTANMKKNLNAIEGHNEGSASPETYFPHGSDGENF